MRAPPVHNLRIRWRILLLALAVLLPAALALAWRLGEEIRESRAAAYLAVSLVRDDAAERLADTRSHAGQLLSFVASRLQARGLEAADCRATLQEVPLIHVGFMRLELRDTAGRLVCWSSNAAPSPSIEASRSNDALRGVLRDPYTGRLSHALTQAMSSVSGTPRGELRLILDLAALSADMRSNGLADGVITVVAGDRTILMRTLEPDALVGTRAITAQATAPGTSGYLEAKGRDGVDRLYAFGPVPGTDWRVFVGLPRERVYLRYDQAWRRTALLMSLVLLAACALAWRLATVIVRPITALQSAARRVATGDLAGHVVVDGPPEMDAMAQDFNRMVDALAMSRTRLQALFDSMSEAVITVDASQVVVMANPAAATMLQCPIPALIGTSLEQWLPAACRDRHRAEVERFGAAGARPRGMGHRPGITALRSDGQEIPIEASISVVDVQGARQYTAVMRDVSEQNRALKAAADAKALLATALANMSDAIVIMDARGRFLGVNDAFHSFYRQPPEQRPAVTDVHELVARLDIRLQDGRAAGADDCALLMALDGRSGSNVIHRLQPLAGGEQWVGSFNFAPIRDAAGNIIGGVTSARDVTALLGAQADLEQSRDALRRLVGSLDAALDDERRRISRELHDELQQIIAAIGIEASAALRQCDAAHPVSRAALDRIEALSRAALSSARRVIADLRPQVLEQLGLASALNQLAAVHARRHHVACDVDCDQEFDADGLSPQVSSCLYRVAQEALQNVAKHAGARHVHIGLHSTTSGTVRLEIRDDGRGLPAGALTKPRAFGLLGMSERVHAMAGSLRVDSQPGGGTTIAVELPLVPSTAAVS